MALTDPIRNELNTVLGDEMVIERKIFTPSFIFIITVAFQSSSRPCKNVIIMNTSLQ